MTKQKCFTEDFEDEAVRLVGTRDQVGAAARHHRRRDELKGIIQAGTGLIVVKFPRCRCFTAALPQPRRTGTATT